MQCVANVTDSADIKEVSVIMPDGAVNQLHDSEAAGYMLMADLWPLDTRHWPLIRFAHEWVILRVNYTDRTRMITHATATVMISNYGKDARCGYASVTVTLEGGDPMEGVDATSDSWKPSSFRTIIAVERGSGSQARSEFDYMLDDARSKVADGKEDDLTPEQQLIMRAFISDSGYQLYHGTAHFLAGRTMQAAPLLKSAFDDMMERYTRMDDAAREAFSDVCFMLGVCAMQFGNSKLAFYYLSMTVNQGNYIHDREYINCLVNNRDYRALELIDAALHDYAEFVKNNDGEVLPQTEDMYHFMRRRKAFICIETGRLDEAETLLRTMVNEEANREFAIDELAYIKKLREG